MISTKFFPLAVTLLLWSGSSATESFEHLIAPAISLEDSSVLKSIAKREVSFLMNGGHVTQIADFPWQVRLLRDPGDVRSGFCGGTLIDDRHVLTAFHCACRSAVTVTWNHRFSCSGPLPLTGVVLGDSIASQHEIGQQMVACENITMHPEGIDLAVCRLERNILPTNTIKPILLARSRPDIGSTVIATGWGAVYDGGPMSNELKYVELRVRHQCIHDFQLCAESINSSVHEAICSGDSGGSLVFRSSNGTYLVGVSSYTDGNCTNARSYSGFISIPEQLQWIESVLQKRLPLKGYVARIADFPWQVRLLKHPTDVRSGYCGGTLIDDRHVLTAYHCVCQAVNVTSNHRFGCNGTPPLVGVVLGDSLTDQFETGQQMAVCQNITMHPEGIGLAICRLDRNILFTDTIKPIPLARSRPVIDSTVIATGWGAVYNEGPMSNELRYSVLRVRGPCMQDFELCAQGTDSLIYQGICHGDSGGPLVSRNSSGAYLVGVSSYASGSCGNVSSYSGFISISEQLWWIDSVLQRRLPLKGYVGRIADFPWQVRLLKHPTDVRSGYCGGTLIDDHHVLTAYHCACQAVNVTSKHRFDCSRTPPLAGVVLGNSIITQHDAGQQMAVCQDITMHPEGIDLAICRLDRNILFTDTIKPIPLARSRPVIDSTVIATGWGGDSSFEPLSNELRYSVLRVRAPCMQDFELCAQSTDPVIYQGICTGDTGGPLLSRNSSGAYLVGVSSYVNGGCGNASSYNGFISIPEQLWWIESVLAQAA